MKLILKLLVLPAAVVVWLLWLVTVIVQKLFASLNGILWGLLAIPVLLACCLQMWDNALFLASLGGIIFLGLLILVLAEALLETARQALAAIIFA